MIGPIHFSVNKRRAEAQQKKQFLKGFPKSLILCFCHVTFSRFVCWEMHPVWMGTALTSAVFPLSETLTLPLTWRSTVAFLGFTNDSVSLKLILSHGDKAWNNLQCCTHTNCSYWLILALSKWHNLIFMACKRLNTHENVCGHACQRVCLCIHVHVLVQIYISRAAFGRSSWINPFWLIPLISLMDLLKAALVPVTPTRPSVWQKWNVSDSAPRVWRVWEYINL